MGFTGLKILGQKEKRIYLVLVIWLLVSFTLIQFSRYIPEYGEILGYILFLPLLGFTSLLFFLSFFLRRELQNYGWKKFLLFALISIPLMIVFFFAFGLLFVIGIISFIFITSLFTMVGCYEKGVEWDEKMYKIVKPFGTFIRFGEFIGGTLIAVIMMIIFAVVGTGWALISENIPPGFSIVPWIIAIVIIVIAIFGGLMILIGRLNAWLGVFFIWVAIYSFYLMFKAFYSLGKTGEGGSDYPLEIQLLLYAFDLILILSTIGSLLGRSEWLSEKLKYIKSDAIIVWLIFSKAAYEFAGALPGLEMGTLKSIGVFVLFVPLFFLVGIYGILRYGKTKKAWKKEKKAEKSAKKEKKMTGSKGYSDELDSEDDIVYCPNCSTPNNTSSKFCKSCGGDISKKKKK